MATSPRSGFRNFPSWRHLLACRYAFRILHAHPTCLETLRARFRFSKHVRILSAKNERKYSERLDVSRQLFVSASVAFLLELQPNKLYSVRFVDQQGKRCVERVLRVHILDPVASCEVGGVFLTHEAAFNAFVGEDSLESLDEVGSFKIQRFHPVGRLPTTESISVNQILSSKYPNYVDYGDLLEEYFSSPRIVNNGDIFSISVDPFGLTSPPKARIFYKIKLSGDMTFETDNRTSIYQLSSCASRFPVRHIQGSFHVPSSIQAISLRIVRFVNGYLKTDIDTRLCVLLTGAGGSGKKLAAAKAAELLGFNLVEVSCYELWSEVSGNSEAKIANFFKSSAKLAPCVCVFKDLSVLGFDQNSHEIDERVMSCFSNQLASAPRDLVTVFTCDSMEVTHLASSVRSLVTSEMRIPDFMEKDRLEWLRVSPLKHLDIVKIGKNTSGFVVSELVQMAVDSAQNAFCDEGRSRIEMRDVDGAIETRNKLFADSVGAPQIPHVDWSEVGGLEETKRLICESLQLNVEGDDKSLKRTGIVLYGPPGCGKTLLAKAVASQFNITFLSVKGPEMLNKYIGQSEENIRNLFERARMASPCVIFFDELDALAPNRGRSGDSGGVMDRVVSQLLAELDSLHAKPNCNVFVMAATNRPDLLDQSLLTPGRFDKTVYVNAAEDARAKCKILVAVSRKVKMDENVDLLQIAQECPKVMSGADLYSIVSKATMEAIRAAVQEVESGHATESDVSISVRMEFLRKALSQVTSSLSAEDVAHYSNLENAV